MAKPTARFIRKVLYKDARTTSPKVSLPKWWVDDVDYVVMKVYADKIVLEKPRG